MAFVHPVDRVPAGVRRSTRLQGRQNQDPQVHQVHKESELYDLEADPYKLQSIHETADPSLVADLKAKLDALRTCAGQSCRKAEDIP